MTTVAPTSPPPTKTLIEQNEEIVFEEDLDAEAKQAKKGLKAIKTVLIGLIAFLIVVVVLVLFFVIVDATQNGYINSPVAESVDVERLKGIWYPLAYTPTFFNNGCDQMGDIYTWEFDYDTNGNMNLFECCQSITSTAKKCKVTNYYPSNGGSFAFNFASKIYLNNPAKFTTNDIWQSNLWFLQIDPSYQWFVAAVPDTKNLFWVVFRSNSVTCAELAEAINVLRYNGFNTGRLVYQPAFINNNNQPCV